jgi:heat shock protein HslJ
MAGLCERTGMAGFRRATWCVPLIALTAFGAAACSGDSGSSAKKTNSATTPLVGTYWVLTDGVSLGVPLAGTTVTAQFGADGRLSGNSGCNSYSTSYTTKGSKLTIDSQIATTLRLCQGAADSVERAYLAKLPEASSYSIAGTTLTVLGSGNSKLLEYRASAGTAAIRGNWTVTGFYTGTAVQSPAPESTLTADFDASTVSGEGGCNNFNGPYTVSGTSITIGPLASTLRACGDPALDTQEQEYLAALQLASSFQAAGNRLDLMRADGGIAVSFQATGRR